MKNETGFEMEIKNLKDRIKGVPEYAKEMPIWVARLSEDGNFWFWGAWEKHEVIRAAEAANRINGIVIANE